MGERARAVVCDTNIQMALSPLVSSEALSITQRDARFLLLRALCVRNASPRSVLVRWASHIGGQVFHFGEAIRYLVSSLPALSLLGSRGLDWCTGVEADKCGILNRLCCSIRSGEDAQHPSDKTVPH